MSGARGNARARDIVSGCTRCLPAEFTQLCGKCGLDAAIRTEQMLADVLKAACLTAKGGETHPLVT